MVEAGPNHFFFFLLVFLPTQSLALPVCTQSNLVPSLLPTICPPSIFWACTCGTDSRGAREPLWRSGSFYFCSEPSWVGAWGRKGGGAANSSQHTHPYQSCRGHRHPQRGSRESRDTDSPRTSQRSREIRDRLHLLPRLQCSFPEGG